jgi:hypothetical protein
MSSTIFKLKQFAFMLIIILACSCMHTTPAFDPSVMNDQDLEQMLGNESRSLDAVKRRLGLNRIQEEIVEGSSVHLLTYRFRVDGRTLFLQVNRSNFVTRAFFADDSPPFVGDSPPSTQAKSNKVFKPM